MEVGRKEHDRYNHQKCEAGCPEHDECGWCEAIKEGNVYADEKPYHFIKLPHHSSASAYCPAMWKEGMIDGGPIATTTIFRCAQGEDLPTKAMLELYKKLSKELYITNSDDDEEGIVNELGDINGIKVIEQYTEHSGIIVCRWKSPEEGWRVKCYGKATLVDNAYIQKYHI